MKQNGQYYTKFLKEDKCLTVTQVYKYDYYYYYHYYYYYYYYYYHYCCCYLKRWKRKHKKTMK